MSEGWMQFLLVAVPVLSLVGSWMALRGVVRRRDRVQDEGGHNKNGARNE